MNFTAKHKEKLAVLFLFTYLIFISAAALHTHNHIFFLYTSHQAGKIKSINEINKSFIDDGSECPLCQFNLTKFFNEPDADLIAFSIHKTFIQQVFYTGQYLFQYFFNINLRAPPSNS